MVVDAVIQKQINITEVSIMKLYLSKLWRGILAVAIVALLQSMLMDVLITVVNVFIPESLALVRNILYLAIPVFWVALVTYLRRQNNSEMRRLYQAELGSAPFEWLTDLKKTAKSPDFLGELFAFLTLLLPIMILFCAVINVPVSLILYPLVFVVIDLSIWMLLHRTWAKERIHRGRGEQT